MPVSVVCRICGLEEVEHHEFVAKRSPEGCKCDPMEWKDQEAVPEVCNEYFPMNPDSALSYCDTCEHDPKCHEEKP